MKPETVFLLQKVFIKSGSSLEDAQMAVKALDTHVSEEMENVMRRIDARFDAIEHRFDTFQRLFLIVGALVALATFAQHFIK